MSRRTTYLLHFVDAETGQAARYKHAGHYIGSTPDGRVDERLAEHRAGHGSVLTAAARTAGLDFVVIRTWPGGRLKERQLKSNAGTRYCPECTERPLEGRARAGSKYLTRRQREAAKRIREARQQEARAAAAADASRAHPAPGWCCPGRPVAACPGCERGARAAHTAECDERERAAARFLAETGAEPREETGMAGQQGPLTGPELDEEIGRLAELYPESAAPGMSPEMVATARRPMESPDAARRRLAERYPEPGQYAQREADPPWLQEVGERYQVGGEIPSGWTDAGDPVYPDGRDKGLLPLPRVLTDYEANPALAPEAAGLSDGAAHADRYLAGRGWQAQGGVYVCREAEREREAG